MQDERVILTELNRQIGLAETLGDREALERLIAPQLAFRRADAAGTLDDRAAFLGKVKPGPDRTTVVSDIRIHGDRALVDCVVTVHGADGDRKFHNLRLFVKVGEDWRLLGWANAPVETG